jgi:broad specificity phosphatase PhoE
MAEDKDFFYEITFARHGESIGNVEDRMQGLSDYPLSETGRAQARALMKRWQMEKLGFDVVIASPLSRASETAQIIASGLAISNLEYEPLWMERDMGKRTGLTWAEIQDQFKTRDFVNPYDTSFEDGEGDWALFLRAGQALHKLLQRPAARYLVVTHGAILNMTLYAILGIAPQPSAQGPRFSLGNTAIASFRYYPLAHRWQVKVIGDRSHWPASAN